MINRWKAGFVLALPLGAQLLAGCTVPGQNADPSTPAARTIQSAHVSETNKSTVVLQQSMIRGIFQSATHGAIAAIPFRVGQTVDVVNRTWGKPTEQNAAGAGVYDTYSRHNAAFGFNKGGQIFDVRQFGGTLRSIHLSDVTHVLGTPGAVRSMPGQTIHMYSAGPDYQLLWVFAKPTATNPDPVVHHISVFCPQYTVNLMAQNEPNPSVVIDQPPGSVGHLLTFSIQHPPRGFTLTSFVWTSTTGQSVVTTLDEALRYGATGGSFPHFEVSGDGQTLSFIYGATQVHHTGRIKLVYQNTLGTAIIGDSTTITLK